MSATAERRWRCEECDYPYVFGETAEDCARQDQARDDDMRASVPDPVPCGVDLLALDTEGLG